MAPVIVVGAGKEIPPETLDTVTAIPTRPYTTFGWASSNDAKTQPVLRFVIMEDEESRYVIDGDSLSRRFWLMWANVHPACRSTESTMTGIMNLVMCDGFHAVNRTQTSAAIVAIRITERRCVLPNGPENMALITTLC